MKLLLREGSGCMRAQVPTHRLGGAFHAATTAKRLLSAAYRPPSQRTLPHGGNRPVLSAGVSHCLKLKGAFRKLTHPFFGIESTCPQHVQRCMHSCIRCDNCPTAQGVRSSAAGSEDHAHVHRRGRLYALRQKPMFGRLPKLDSLQANFGMGSMGSGLAVCF